MKKRKSSLLSNNSLLANSLVDLSAGSTKVSAKGYDQVYINLVFVSDKDLDAAEFLSDLLGRRIEENKERETKHLKRVYAYNKIINFNIYNTKVSHILREKAASITLDEDTIIVLLFDEMSTAQALMNIKEKVIDIYYDIDQFWLMGVKNDSNKLRRLLNYKAVKQIKALMSADEYIEVLVKERQKFWGWFIKKKYKERCTKYV